MLTKAWRKIDRFYLILAIVLMVLAVPVIYTSLGILSAFTTVYEIDNEADREARLDKTKLDQAVTSIYHRDIPTLQVRETAIAEIVDEN
ncbi:hypothetical protein IPM62_06065 [Candidatus Woesebacteria bacterium]|nr:MAG: hypothetical protein IPM62_06065 [Candidatus Woesebacteria bacterium]